MSQETLAEESGLSRRTIQRIELGESNPNGDSLKRLAEALQVNCRRTNRLGYQRRH